MFKRLLQPPENKSFFLFGPRGTGKTTWVKEQFPSAVYLDLLEAKLFNDLLADPQRLDNFIPRGFDGWVVIDEVQRVPELLNEVHRLIERDRRKFVLTGSSARKLRRSGENLLAGRALTYAMHPLAAPELKEKFNLEKVLSYGALPSVFSEADPSRYLESYVQTYLEEEVKEEGLTRKIGAFARFLEAASFSQSAVLNISAVARECAVERKVVEDYFRILEDLLIARRLPVFTRRAKRRLPAHPKFYYFDAGVYRTLRPKGPLDRPEEIEGAALETIFWQQALAVNDSLGLGYNFYYWRTTGGAEVDFVLYGQNGFKAFEIKRAARLDRQVFDGLKSFQRDYPEAELFLLYGGNRRLKEGSINIWPLDEALKDLPGLLKKA